jgi:hypothetical protein
MFDLEEAIASWKTAQRANGESLPADAPAELESHLRDQIAEFREFSQLSDEEAFLLACHRLGEPAALDHEFAKDGTGILWARRIFWMLAGYLAVKAVVATAIVAGGAVRTATMLGSQGGFPTMSVVAGAIATLLFGVGLCAVALRSFRREEAQLSRIARFLMAHPFALIFGVGLLFLGETAFSILTNMLVARHMSVEAFGSMHIANAVSSPAVNGLFFLGLAIGLIVCHRRGWGHASAASR